MRCSLPGDYSEDVVGRDLWLLSLVIIRSTTEVIGSETVHPGIDVRGSPFQHP